MSQKWFSNQKKRERAEFDPKDQLRIFHRCVESVKVRPVEAVIHGISPFEYIEQAFSVGSYAIGE